MARGEETYYGSDGNPKTSDARLPAQDVLE